MKNFLLHTCCAPCGAYIIQELVKRSFKVTAFFYNLNIFPEQEYILRKNEIQKYCEDNKIKFIQEKYDHDVWFKNVADLEDEPEGGKRCEVCYKMRLEKTADYAQKNGYENFGSTLSISPHKDAQVINKIGQGIAKEYNLTFDETDWGKDEGFKKSCELSHKSGFYRQNYCGCELSLSASAPIPNNPSYGG